MTAPTMLPDVSEQTQDELAPPCQYRSKSPDACSDSAEWYLVALCGCIKLFCTPHKESQINIGMDGVSVRCPDHKLKWQPGVSPWVTVEKL